MLQGIHEPLMQHPLLPFLSSSGSECPMPAGSVSFLSMRRGVGGSARCLLLLRALAY